jgi:hypothetical protein
MSRAISAGPNPLCGVAHTTIYFLLRERKPQRRARNAGEKICIAGKPLTRLAALGTLSRGAGEGLQRILHKAPLRAARQGGPNPTGSARNAGRGQAQGLAGEGIAAFRLVPTIFSYETVGLPAATITGRRRAIVGCSGCIAVLFGSSWVLLRLMQKVLCFSGNSCRYSNGHKS